VAADVYVDAMGLGRDIRPIPLYRKLIEGGVVEPHPEGGIRVNLETRQVITKGGSQKNLYAIGTMARGETILTHNSLTVAQLGIEVGRQIVESLRPLESKAKENTIAAIQTADSAIAIDHLGSRVEETDEPVTFCATSATG
jgi:uncharacterized NAD(P)/FAD-binding protein YdhS